VVTSEGRYEVVCPTGRWVGTPAAEPATPPAAAGPRRIGFVWDYVFRGDEMFRVAEEELRARDPGLTFVGYEAFGDIHGAGEAGVLAALPELIRAEEVEAVIVGVGA